MAEYVVAQAAVLIVPSLKKFQKQLEIELRRNQALTKPVKIDVEANTKKFVTEALAAKKMLEKDPVNIKFRVLDATKQITEIRYKYEDLSREMKKGLLLNLKVTGLSLLPQLATGLAAANASMVQLVQTAALLPGVLAGAGSSIAALATGLSGIKDAFKEYGDAQKNSAQEGLKARNAAINVGNAYRDLGRSIKDAKRNLEDLNAQLRDAPLDEADAIIRVAEARAEAADKAQKSGIQQQKDLLALQRAENDLVNVRLRNSRLVQDVAEANAKGVAGADAVREATDRLSKAQDEAATQVTKLSDSLKELSPNAQAFVQTVTGMQAQWTGFKNAVQDSLFAGLDREITRLGSVALPTLQQGFVGIADALNSNVKSAFAALETQTNQGFLAKIFGDTAAAQSNLSKAFDPFVDSLLRLSAAGTDFLPRLVDGLSELLARFDNFVVRAEGDGSIERWINQGIDEFKALGNAIINVGSILDSLSQAFTDSGGKTFLQSLESATKRLADFLNTDTGEDRLKQFFVDARAELAKWQPLLSQLPELLANVSAAGQMFANMFLPFLTDAARLLGEHPLLVKAIFTAYVGLNGVLPILKGLSSGVGLVNKSVDFFRTKVDDGGNKTTGFKKKVGDLTGALVSPGGLVGAATLAATWIGTNLATAHAEAAEAAQRQMADLNNLRDSLDAVTGSATAATEALVAKNFRQGLNEATGISNGDLLKSVADPNALISKVASGDLQGALGMVRGATGNDVAATGFWKSYGKSLEDAGLNADTVAKAVNGDPDAKKRFEDWYSKQKPGFGPSQDGGVPIPFLDQAPDSVKRGLAESGVISLPSTLLDLQNQLPDQVKLGSQIQGEIYSNTIGLRQSGQDIRTDNTRAFGRWRLKPGSPFDSLGVVGDPGVDANGGGLIVRSQPAPSSALSEQLRNDGVSFQPDGTDRFIVRVSPDAILKYFDKYAAGGLISGPGSGTSDSILARLSRGEFVVNARSTQQHLPLLEQINGGSMPGFADGGLFGGSFGAPAPTPAPKPKPVDGSVSSVVGFAASPTRGFMGSAAGATAAETAVASTVPDIPFSGTPSKRGMFAPPWGVSAASRIGNFFKGAMGLGAPGYTETSTATLNTDFKWYGGSAPEAPKPPVKPVPGKPNSTMTSLGNISSGLYGVPYSPKAPAPKAPAPKMPAPKMPAPKPSTSGVPMVHGSGGSPGPGNEVPHVVPGLPARPGPYPSATVAAPAMSSAIPAPLMAEAGFQLPGYSGLPMGTNIGYGGSGFPDWVYQAGEQFGMLPSTYAGHQEGGGTNKGIDWAPNGISWNTPEGAEAMTRYAKYLASLGIMEQVIYQNPFTGETVGVYNGKPVGPGTDLPEYYRDDWSGHQDHIHTRMSRAIPTPAQLQSMGVSPGANDIWSALASTSPSNMPAASTPTGVMLPQLSYAPGVSGVTGAPSTAGSAGSAGGMGLRLPTPEEYAKYVSESWMGTLQNLVKNAGSIATNFVGSFFGLDLSKITGTANSILGGIDLPGMNNNSSSSGDSNLPADASVQQMLDSSLMNSLPPEYQKVFEEEAAKNPDAAFPLLQQLAQMAASGGGAVQYDPSKGAEQWRPVVRQALQKIGANYGITNVQAWEDAMVRQIQTESGGNPNVDNLNDTDGKGGTQAVYGLGQFLPTTFAAHNVTGGDLRDPVAQIYAMIDYVATKYGMDTTGAPKQIGRGVGYASGGMIKGRGSGSSDSIIARVSNGEYIVRAPMASKHMGLLEAINSNRMPGFAEGGVVNPLVPPPVTPPPPPAVSTPTPPPAPLAPDPMGPRATTEAGVPAPTATPAAPGEPTAGQPVDPAAATPEGESNTLADIGAALGGLGGAISGEKGASAPAGGTSEGDPRSALGAAPQNLDHNKPAVSQGIQAAGAAISSAINTAIQAAAAAGSAGANVAAPGAGQGVGAGAGAASSLISGLVNAGSGAVAGAVNILSSLGVGSITPTGTGGAYGTPMLPQNFGQNPYTGPSVVNNWNGGVHTSNNEEFYKIQQRRELQNASPYLSTAGGR